ncbi:MAG: BamA/TamA family outer membrane protein [Pirellulales bacterium]
MLHTLTEQKILTKSKLGLFSFVVVCSLFSSGCQQFAQQRKLYTPPSATSVLEAKPNSALKPDDSPSQNLQEQSQTDSAPYNQSSTLQRTNSQSTKNQNSPWQQFAASQTDHNKAHANIAPTSSLLTDNNEPKKVGTVGVVGRAGYGRSTDNKADSKAGFVRSGSNQATAANKDLEDWNGAFAARRIQSLSPYAIVRGQSGWYPTNGPTDPGTGVPSAPTAPLGSAGGYAGTIAPGTVGGQGTIAPGVAAYDPTLDVPAISAPGGYRPNIQVAPLDVYVQEKRTGRVILGGSVNSDLGVAGQLIIDERNFDIRAVPRSWSDLFSGYAFRGAGQSFRVELMPGNRVDRYTVNWTTPNLFGYMPYSLSVGGFLFTRQYQDWLEKRVGGRIGIGYNITKDLSIGTEVRGENVKISHPRVSGVQKLDSVLGKNELYSARFNIAHDTRDSSFLATEGGLLQLSYEQAFGKFDYPQGQVNYSRYFRVNERADGQGRHVLATTWKLGFSGNQTPIFENFFAGGFSSMRGFRFRGASPVEGGVQVGGHFMFLGSLEYMFPLTADEMLRGVAFVDYGTVEQNITIKKENFRVSPGLGLRIAVPMLGPAPLAFDFAVPVSRSSTDQTQLLSFYMGFTR